MMDLTPATELTATIVTAVSDDDLQRPTPCSEMTVEALLGHLHGLAVAFGDAARKVDGPTTNTAPDPSETQLPKDWRTATPSALASLAEAWADPTAWTGITRAGGQEMPGEVAGMVALDEVVLHGWDLASAVGQPYPVSEAGVAAVEAFCAEVPDDPAARDGLFGPRVPVPEDASRWERALGLAGRDPAWRPPA